MQPEQKYTPSIPLIRTSEHDAPLTLCYNWLPCSSLTAHTMRSTQAALAWQRSLRELCSPGNPPVSWSTRCSSDWLLLNCSSTKSWTSRTNAGCRSEIHEEKKWLIQWMTKYNNNHAIINKIFMMLYLSCSIVCPAAFWTHTHTECHWRFCSRGSFQD